MGYFIPPGPLEEAKGMGYFTPPDPLVEGEMQNPSPKNGTMSANFLSMKIAFECIANAFLMLSRHLYDLQVGFYP